MHEQGILDPGTLDESALRTRLEDNLRTQAALFDGLEVASRTPGAMEPGNVSWLAALGLRAAQQAMADYEGLTDRLTKQ